MTLGDTRHLTHQPHLRGEQSRQAQRRPRSAYRRRVIGLAPAAVDRRRFVTNLRIPALERLGLAHESLAQAYPELIYALLTAHGLKGSDRDAPGYDVGAFWSRAGIATSLTPPGAAPPYPRGGMGDRPAGMALAGAVCAALFVRTRTGRGQLVTTSLLRQGTYTIASDLTSALRKGSTMPRHDPLDDAEPAGQLLPGGR